MSTTAMTETELEARPPLLPPPVLSVPTRAVLRTEAAAGVFFLLAHAAVATSTHVFDHALLGGLVPMFLLHGEGTAPAFASSLALLFCAGVLSFLAMTAPAHVGPPSRRWWVLAAVFAYLAVDEAIGLHELAVGPMRAALDLEGLLRAAWIVPAVVVVGAFAWWSRQLLRLVHPGTARRFVVAGACYLAGAVVLEAFGVSYLESVGDRPDLTYECFVAVEEALELIGIVLFTRALLDEVKRRPVVVEVVDRAR